MKRGKPSKKITFIFISLLVTIVVAASGWRAWQSYRGRIWDYPGRLNLLDSNNLILTSVSDVGAELVEIKLPKEPFVEVPGGYGSYRLKDIKSLGESEGGKSEELLRVTVSSLLGIPVDVEVKSLTFWDKAKTWWLRKSPQRRVKTIDLETLPVFVEEERADGAKIKKIETSKVDFYLTRLFWEKALREESLKIGVFNASTRPGLAQRAARLIENIGGLVVEVANWEEDGLDQCRIKTDKEHQRSITFLRLRRIFPCEVILEKLEERFDLLLIL